MQRLRSLMGIVIVLFFSSGFAKAQKNTFKLKKYLSQVQVSHQQTETQGQPIISSRDQRESRRSEQSLSINLPELNKIKSTLAVLKSQEDFSRYVLQDERGLESNLGSSFNGEELKLQGKFEAQISSLTTRASHTRTMSDSPLASAKSSLGLSKSFNHQFSEVGLDYQFGEQKRPLSYFTDLANGQRRERATRIQFQSYQLSFQQVLHERIKARLTLENSVQTDRPDAIGYQIQTSVAASSRDFIRLGYREIREQDRVSLKDDRGYFQFKGYESMYSRYLSYDWSVGLGYGLLVEQEDQPQLRRRDQMAADVFLLETGYQGNSWNGKLRYQQIASNINYRSQILGGEFSWNF